MKHINKKFRVEHVLGRDKEIKTEIFWGCVTWFFGKDGAHFRCPGFLYTRNGSVPGWSVGRSWRLFGIVCLRHLDTKGGHLKHISPGGWSVRFARVRVLVKLDAADWHTS